MKKNRIQRYLFDVKFIQTDSIMMKFIVLHVCLLFFRKFHRVKELHLDKCCMQVIFNATSTHVNTQAHIAK